MKIAEETGTEELLPDGFRWKDLVDFKGDDLLFHYQEMLTHLGGTGATKVVREIYAFPTTVI
jgi:type I restriction enzyme M protein